MYTPAIQVRMQLSIEDLRSQYQWLLAHDDCPEKEGLIMIIESLMGYGQPPEDETRNKGFYT